MSNKQSLSIVLATILIVGLLASPRTKSAVLLSPQAETMIIKDLNFNRTYLSHPYEISELTLNGQQVNLETPLSFNEIGDDWIKKLSFTFTNISEKSITRMFIKLLLKNPDKTKFSAFLPLYAYASASASPNFPQSPDIKPGDKIHVTLEERYVKDVERMLQKAEITNLRSIKEATIWVDRLEFSDSTIWTKGRLYRPDPTDPQKLTPIEKISFNPKQDHKRNTLIMGSVEKLNIRGIAKSFAPASRLTARQPGVCGMLSDPRYTTCPATTPSCSYYTQLWHPAPPADWSNEGVALDSCFDVYWLINCNDVWVPLYNFCI